MGGADIRPFASGSWPAALHQLQGFLHQSGAFPDHPGWLRCCRECCLLVRLLCARCCMGGLSVALRLDTA